MLDEYLETNANKHNTSCYLDFVFKKRTTTIANVSTAEREKECDGANYDYGGKN